MVNKLSYKLRHFHGLIAASMEAKQLENDLEAALLERDALKAELKATESRLHEVAVGCANAEFELEAAKENHRIHAARLISEKILVSEHLEAALKQEPCGWQCRFITPTETWGYCSKEHYETVKAAPHEYPGYEVRAVYARPVPAQPSRDLLRAIVDATWGHAYESEQVPSTDTADKIINAVLSKFTAAANHEGTNHGNG